MTNLTPSETETLKMFEEQRKWVEELYDGCLSGRFFGKTGVKIIPLCDFISSQLRLARADERKQAYEDGKNAVIEVIEIRLPNPMTEEEREKYHCEGSVLHWGEKLLESARKA